MPRKKKTNGEQPIGIGYTSKQMKRKKPISNTYLIDIEPITENQKILFNSYKESKNIIDNGAAGKVKTFVTLYNDFKDVLDENTPYDEFLNDDGISNQVEGGLSLKIEYEMMPKNQSCRVFASIS